MSRSKDCEDEPIPSDWDYFTQIYEEFAVNQDTGESHTCSKFIVIDDDSNAFIAELPLAKLDITFDQAKGSLRKIPETDIYPPAYQDISIYAASPNDAGRVYIKRPKVGSHSWYEGSTVLAERFLAEAQTLELVKRNPHPNIVQFYGCIVKNGRIVALALQRYPRTLASLVEEQDDGTRPAPATVERWLHDIKSGVQHLHGLGLAHNDINPHNVMQDEGGNMVLVDLGSCARFGETLSELGTPGWNEGFSEESATKNDEIGLAKIGEWLVE